MRIGYRHEPNFVTERTLAVVASLEREEFVTSDILARDPDLGRHRIQTILLQQLRRGSIERIAPGTFRKGGTRIRASHLPSGLASVAVWAVLFTDPQRRSLRLAEVVGETESFLGRSGKDLRATVAVILHRWHRDGYLDRDGERGEYRYRLKDGITERPQTLCSPRT